MAVFDEVRQQIEWAETRIELARVEIEAYINNDAFVFLREDDTNTGEVVHKVRLKSAVPMSVKGYLRNAIVDLKHSFDMSLNEAASHLNGSPTDRNYPWADSPTGIEGITGKWQSKSKTRVPPEIIDEIFRQQPHRTGEHFSGGDDLAREIAKMANDKHSIGIVAQAQVSGFSMTNVVISGQFAAIGRPWDLKKQEMEIARYRGSLTYDNSTVTGNVFFERVGRMGPVPAIAAAVTFLNKAKKSLEGFEALVAKAHS